MRLHVERGGSGPSVVLSHGIGSDCRTWDNLRPFLEPVASVTVWDLPGHGKSERTDDPADYSADLALADLVALVEPAPPAILVGHSFGGYLSLALAQQRPELVRGLVLVATGPGFRDPSARTAWNEMMLGSEERRGLPPAVLHIGVQHDSSVLDRLGTITVPVFVVVGERDRRFHAAAEVFAAKLGAPVLWVEGAGHHPHESHAGIVGPAVLDFVRRETGGHD